MKLCQPGIPIAVLFILTTQCTFGQHYQCEKYPWKMQAQEYKWEKETCQTVHATCAEPAMENLKCGSTFSPCGNTNHLCKELYRDNQDDLEMLKSRYCISSTYLFTLTRKNDAAYNCETSCLPNRCHDCFPSLSPPHRTTLTSLHRELQSLLQHCMPVR